MPENPETQEKSEKEKRVRAITRLYYSNPQVQQALLDFSKDREVVPRYYESFGKRPDTLQYLSDIMGLVNKGATSFHASEEIWQDPLSINSDMSSNDLTNLRKSWDLLIDIDSPFLDYSKVAAKLLIEELENHEIFSYGIKFSGSKGMHIIVPAKAFPTEFQGIQTKNMFPEWPRAIVQYLTVRIKPEFTKRLRSAGIDFEAIQERMNISKEDLTSINCPKPECGGIAHQKQKVYFKCNICGTDLERPDYKITAKKLKCIAERCRGYFEVISSEEYFVCDKCGFSTHDKIKTSLSSRNKVTIESNNEYAKEFREDLKTEEIAPLDLVLVAPRHLFRMPYSLHEKTALSSIVIDKEELNTFRPKDANPLKIIIKPYYKDSTPGEATKLLKKAILWKSETEPKEEKKRVSEKYASDFTGVTEEMFPPPIKKLLKGLQEGRKRGLFILLTFLKSLNYPNDYISQKIRDWNKQNDPPLKEGYIKSQLDWHFKQKKKILPPNYNNDGFYKDLKLLDSIPKYKNPLVEVARKLRKSNYSNQ
jgi:hypothetical protein